MVRNLVLVWCFLSLIAYVALSDVVLVGNNMTLSFKDVEASFALPVTGPGECGTLSLAEPLDACSALSNKGNDSAFVLVIRGQCSFEGKVRMAQAAGFKAAIIYDNVDGDLLTITLRSQPNSEEMLDADFFTGFKVEFVLRYDVALALYSL